MERLEELKQAAAVDAADEKDVNDLVECCLTAVKRLEVEEDLVDLATACIGSMADLARTEDGRGVVLFSGVTKELGPVGWSRLARTEAGLVGICR